MTVLFLDQYGHASGAQRCLVDLLPEIAARGWRAVAAVPAEGTLRESLEAGGATVETIACGPYSSTRKTGRDFVRFAWETPALAWKLRAFASAAGCDLIYVNGPRLLPAAAMVARGLGCALVFHCHVRLMQPAAIRAARWALRWSGATLIACCAYAAAPLWDAAAPGKRHVVPNGTATPLAGPEQRTYDRARRIGVVGRIEPDKGQMEFLEAARILAPQFPDLRFVVTGAPLYSGPAYFERVVEAGRGLPVDFPGWEGDPARIYSSLDLLAVPSAAHDPSPRVIPEAFAAGVPVVAFPSGGIGEIVHDGENGFLTAGRGAAALASRLRDVVGMATDQRRAVAVRARRDWEERYTVERYRQRICAVIAQVRS